MRYKEQGVSEERGMVLEETEGCQTGHGHSGIDLVSEVEIEPVKGLSGSRGGLAQESRMVL